MASAAVSSQRDVPPAHPPAAARDDVCVVCFAGSSAGDASALLYDCRHDFFGFKKKKEKKEKENPCPASRIFLSEEKF